MKNWIHCFIILLTGLSYKISAQSSQHDSIAKYLANMPEQTQLSVAVIKNGKVDFIGVIKNSGQPQFVENRDSIFEIGSITKVFTSTILATTVKMGIIGLDDSISKTIKLKKVRKDYPAITYKMLANHTSGLPRLPYLFGKNYNPENPYAAFGPKELEDYFENEMSLLQAPGTKMAYSNLAVGTLGYLLEKKRKDTYENLLQADVFRKFGMNSSTTIHEKIKDQVVAGRNEKGKIVLNWDLNALAGAGAILSSANDLSRFALANFQPSEILELQRTKTFTTSDRSIGLAWQIATKPDGNEVYWHNGGTGGYRSYMIIDTTTKNGVIVLSNAGNSDYIDVIGVSLMWSINN